MWIQLNIQTNSEQQTSKSKQSSKFNSIHHLFTKMTNKKLNMIALKMRKIHSKVYKILWTEETYLLLNTNLSNHRELCNCKFSFHYPYHYKKLLSEWAQDFYTRLENGKLSILKSKHVHSVLKNMFIDCFIVSSW